MNLNDIKKIWEENISVAKSSHSNAKNDFQGISVSVHNATWCPDCVREVSELLALDEQANTGFEEIILHSYEDSEQYKIAKANGELSISCLPTLIFQRGEEEVLRIEEDSNGQLANLLANIS